MPHYYSTGNERRGFKTTISKVDSAVFQPNITG